MSNDRAAGVVKEADGVARATTQTLALRPALLNKRLPLWHQLAECLRAAIIGRQPGEPLRLPPETELARHYGVSLITIREALATIEAEGLIRRRRRKGTFIEATAPTDQPLRLIGSLETVFSQQQAASADVLEHGVCAPPAELAARFAGVGEVAFFRRLRRNHAGVAVSHAVNYLPLDHGRQVPLELLRDQPMTRILRDTLGVPIARIEDIAAATLAASDIAAALGIAPHSPVLLMTGLTFAAGGRLVDAARIHYRGDLYRFAVSFDVTNGIRATG